MTSTFDLPQRLLLGAGPSQTTDRVLRALGSPTLGHLDPAFGELLDDLSARLRTVFRTENRVAFPVSGTGSAGMETMVANLVSPGDRVICGIHGLFGERMADELARHGAHVVRVEGEWGRAIPLELMTEATKDGFDAMFVVHAETSTGVAQPLDGLADLCRANDALLLVDCVTSLGGHRLELDAWGVDAAFSGTQKCLNVPPGLAPFTLGPRAVAKAETVDCPSWYFDLSLVLGYWSGDGGRAYHHTAPINLIYGLHEGLGDVIEEGLEARWARHERAHGALLRAVRALGLERLAPEGEQLNSLLAVRIPEGVDDAAVRGSLLLEDGIEISGGVGKFAGSVWRLGVMGFGANPEPQRRLVEALAKRLGHEPADALAELDAGWTSD
ncbi:MAG: alanine--glyoxylate aminotransferase family protein [Solirubrobacteraceae bacterium]|nr:alanine--glyoxylate aminotransferase family protein [Solirubrobacteraceae bacterium]